VGTRFSAPAQTGPVAHLASCTMGTGSFPGVKRPRHGVNPHYHLVPRLKEVYSSTSTPLLGLRDLFLSELCLLLYFSVYLLGGLRTWLNFFKRWQFMKFECLCHALSALVHSERLQAGRTGVPILEKLKDFTFLQIAFPAHPAFCHVCIGIYFPGSKAVWALRCPPVYIYRLG
jgi:hypothetical protein